MTMQPESFMQPLSRGADSALALQQILDHATAVVFVKDRDGRYQFANRRFLELFGLKQAAILGRTDAEIFPLETAANLRRNDTLVFERDAPIEIEEQVPQQDGTHTYLSLKFPLRNSRNEVYAVCGISTDITARKRTEEVLRQSAIGVSGAGGGDIFTALVSYCANALGVDYAFIALPCADNPERMRTVALHAQGRIVDNIEYDLPGTPCANVVGQQFRLYPRDVHRLFPGENMLAQGSIESYAGFPLSDSQGRSIGLIAVMHGRPLADDRLVESMLKIFAARAVAELERERADAAQRASETSYRAVFEASEDAIFVHDWDTGAIVDVNPKACAAYGYTREEFLRIDVGALSSGVPPYTLEHAVQYIERAKAGMPQRVEWQRRNKDGSLHWDEVHIKAAIIGGKQRVLVFTREITERKMAEEALRASEERYHTIFNASVDGLALCTPDGRIMEANPAFCRLHGYTREELLAAESFQFVHPDSHLRCWAFFEAASAGHSLKSEASAQRKDGTLFDTEVHGVPVNYGSEPHLLLIMRDISERKRAETERTRLEAQLRQAQKMEAIGHLTGGVAHDFNNILTAVMGYVAMAQEHVAARVDEKLDKYLDGALRSGRQARDLIQQMLTFSRGRRGEPRALQLPPPLKESVQLMRSALPSSIEFDTEIDTALPAVLLDPIQLEQVLMNLCINARDAMQGAGTLHIALRMTAHRDGVCTSCRQPVRGAYVELSVRDTGPGIAPQVVERMFEPFFTTKEVGKGSGMGLSTVHGIVHEYGGHIIVETASGRGASFRVLFKPMLRIEGGNRVEEPEPASDAAEVRRLDGRALLVDDEPAVREFMGELLESWGLEVTVKRDGAEAEALFAEDPQRFDLVVTDQTMPKMTGIELAQRLLARRPGLPVVLYTGYTERLTEAQTHRSGIRALVTKPLDIAAFFGLVHDILQ